MQGIFSTIRGAISHDVLKGSQLEALNNKEKKILIQQWTAMIELNPDLFKKAWIRSSQRSTSIKKAFGMEENEDPEKNELFMRLPNTIEAFFKYLIIDCECDEKKIHQKCEEMGARHIDFSSRGFHSNFWDIFLVCMTEGIKECSMNFNGEQQKVFVFAWQHLLNIVVKDMRTGYDERRRKESLKRPK